MIENKTILLFGGTGSLGYEIVKRYINNNIIYNYSRDECKHWQMKLDFNNNNNLHFIIGDVINKNKVEESILRINPNIVIIASAMKHIEQCEYNTDQSLNTNLLGVKNILDTIEIHKNELIGTLETVLFVSSDKACSPINVYGMCKAICEELIIEKSKHMSSVKFMIVRYGNVVNSTSSLLPTLLKNTSDTYYITDIRMTRFWMTIDDACNTIEYALKYGNSGEVIIPKVKSFYVKDMINYIAELKGKTVKIMGLRPGERLYETLINDTQSIRTIDTQKYYHIVPYYKKYKLVEPFVYDSNTDIITDNHELLKLFKEMKIA